MRVEIVTREELEDFHVKVIAELTRVIQGQQEIMELLCNLKKSMPPRSPITSEYIPAMEYMRAVGIKRWKFDQLIAENKIQVVKKKRKIYVPIGEVERYFKDPNIR